MASTSSSTDCGPVSDPRLQCARWLRPDRGTLHVLVRTCIALTLMLSAAGCAEDDDDECSNRSCTVPPPPTCTDDGQRVTYAETGSCQAGVCAYPATVAACPEARRCDAGECVENAASTD